MGCHRQQRAQRYTLPEPAGPRHQWTARRQAASDRDSTCRRDQGPDGYDPPTPWSYRSAVCKVVWAGQNAHPRAVQPSHHPPACSSARQRPTAWQRRPQRKTAQRTGYGAKTPGGEWALRPLGVLGSSPLAVSGGRPLCPTTPVADSGVLDLDPGCLAQALKERALLVNEGESLHLRDRQQRKGRSSESGCRRSRFYNVPRGLSRL